MAQAADDTVVVSTDGSGLSNGIGATGWGWVNHAVNPTSGQHDCDAGGANRGTNNIGELCAVLEVLRAYHEAAHLIIYADSQYAINSSTTWVAGWKKKGWKNAAKQPVKNVEIIKAIDVEMRTRPGSVEFRWVKGHAGDEFNERVDQLAHGYADAVTAGRAEGRLPLEGWLSLLRSEYAQGVRVPDAVKAQLAGRDDACEQRSGTLGRPTADQTETAATHETAPAPTQAPTHRQDYLF